MNVISPVAIHRLAWTLAIAAGVVLLIVVAVVAYVGIWWRPARLVMLKYLVVAIRADGSYAFAADSYRLLQDPRPSWADMPNDGAILIDSDFNLYTERDVRVAGGELGELFRKYVGPTRPATYRIGLRKWWRAGPELVHAKLAACTSYAGDNGSPDSVREELTRQTTMAGIVAVLTRNTVDTNTAANPRPATLPTPFVATEDEN